MVFVYDSFRRWCGDLSAIELISATPQTDREMILEAINSGVKRGERFRVGWYICYVPTNIEEAAIRKYWKQYFDNTAMYAGDDMAKCVMDFVANNTFVRIGGSVFLKNNFF